MAVRRLKAVLVGVLAVAFWSTFMFFMASWQIVAPSYHTPSVQRSAELMRIGYFALMGVLYVTALAWSVWLAVKVWKGDL